MVLYEKLKGKLDDEIKRAGLESLVPEELEKHLIFNSNRLETFEDLYSEVVKYVEEKTGLRISDFKLCEAGFCKRSDPTDVGVVSSLLSDSGVGCFKSGGAHFQRNYNARRSTGKQSCGKGNQSKSWSKSGPSLSGKGKSKENKGKSKGTRSANQGAKGSHKGKTSITGLSGLDNSVRDKLRNSGIGTCLHHSHFPER